MMKKELTKSEAKEKALRLLAFRSHSEKELSDKLIMAGAKREDLPYVMDFVKEYGFVNDGEYACHLAKDLKNLKKYGKKRIADELKKRGISAEYIENALSELTDDEEEALLPLVEKKLSGSFEQKSIDRAIRYFIYRGYAFDDIKRCIEKIKEKREAE
ncbi:MAG: regulatory protein RecX [Clostridia bacterium]|nr:regulatory protein RecX [Clostridia bacterium]